MPRLKNRELRWKYKPKGNVISLNLNPGKKNFNRMKLVFYNAV